MGKEKLNKEQREMNYYSQKSVGWIIADVLLAPLLNKIPLMPQRQGGIEDLYYLISGKRKKFRKLQALKQQDEIDDYNATICQAIRKYFGDDFFKHTLHLSENEINQYLLFCIPKNIVLLFEERRELELMDVLISQVSHFKTDK